MRATVQLAGDRTAPVACRGWLRQALEGEDPAIVQDAVLLASELVTNCVLYARGVIEVSLQVDPDVIRVEVRDGSPALPAPRHYGLGAASGRGLSIVEQVAGDWGAELSSEGEGKVVWFRLDRPAGAGRPGRRNGCHQDRVVASAPVGGSPRTGRPVRTFRFLGTPVDVLDRAWEEYGDFLRELRLIDDPGLDWSPYEAASAISPDLRVFYLVRQHALAATSDGRDGQPDVTLELDRRAGEAARLLGAFLDAAEARHRDGGRLLAPLPGPASRSLRRWLLGELARQGEGKAPERWPGPVPAARRASGAT